VTRDRDVAETHRRWIERMSACSCFSRISDTALLNDARSLDRRINQLIPPRRGRRVEIRRRGGGSFWRTADD